MINNQSEFFNALFNELPIYPNNTEGVIMVVGLFYSMSTPAKDTLTIMVSNYICTKTYIHNHFKQLKTSLSQNDQFDQ